MFGSTAVFSSTLTMGLGPTAARGVAPLLTGPPPLPLPQCLEYIAWIFATNVAVVQSLSLAQIFVIPRTAASQASPSLLISRSLLKLCLLSQYRVELHENRWTTLAEFLLEQLRDPSHIVSTQYLLVNWWFCNLGFLNSALMNVYVKVTLISLSSILIFLWV